MAEIPETVNNEEKDPALEGSESAAAPSADELLKEDIYESAVYKRSRRSYVIQCMVEYFITLTVTDAFLVKLLKYMGFDDAKIGIISSLCSMAFLFQLLSMLITRTRVCRKTVIMIADIISQLLLSSLFLIPFLPFGTTNKLIIMIAVLFANGLWYLMYSTTFQWANSNVDPHKRASFSATKEIISLITGIVYTLAIGWMFDFFEAQGSIQTAFVWASVIMFTCCVADFICLLLIRKDTPEERGDKKSFREILRHTLGVKNFRSIVYLTVLWEFGRYFSIGFLGTLKTEDLSMNVLLIQIVNIGAALCRMFASRPFGKYSDRTSFAHGIKLALLFAAGSFAAVILTTKATWYMIIAQAALMAVCMAGFNANSFNIVYSYVDAHYVPEAMAIKNSIGGVCGFLSSLIASRILAAVQANGNTVFGIQLFGQQLLACVSLLLMLAAFLFTHFVITRQKVMVQ
ncbi:MAG: MFS transporter [Clostridia bacterium]|nr:MFS transporter [Clostridia bacterium]